MIATVFKTTTRLLCTTLLSVIVVCAQSQVADRTEGDTSQRHASPVKTDIGAPSLPYQTGTQNIVVGKENVSVFTTGLGPTPVENMISQLESQECTAILKQDTAVLRRFWGRDFTLNDPLNEVVTGKTSLPY